MNKKEYLDILAKDLGSLPYTDVKEIVDEIDAHFECAKGEGKSEEQISDELGDVHELAKSYINCTPYKLPQVLKEKEPNKKKAPVFAKILSVLLCIIAVPITACWVSFDAGLATSTIWSIVAFFISITKLSASGNYLSTMIFAECGTFFFIVFRLCLLYFGITLLIFAGKKFIRFNRKLWTKGV
ncbi:MAG: DUF1700 domain-containing protein [Clostridiales bacterium]|nr:DUF1700 domain-containing protein [Clostridiales bacterium]